MKKVAPMCHFYPEKVSKTTSRGNMMLHERTRCWGLIQDFEGRMETDIIWGAAAPPGQRRTPPIWGQWTPIPPPLDHQTSSKVRYCHRPKKKTKNKTKNQKQNTKFLNIVDRGRIRGRFVSLMIFNFFFKFSTPYHKTKPGKPYMKKKKKKKKGWCPLSSRWTQTNKTGVWDGRGGGENDK